MIQLFKIVNHKEDISTEKFFEFNDNRTRGHIFKITKPSCNKSLRLNTFPVRSINQWNTLKEDIVCSESVLTFKSKLDKAWGPDRFNIQDIY